MSLLRDAGGELRDCPAPTTWYSIEHPAHGRDITALHRWAVSEALSGREPVDPAIDADDLIESAVATFAAADPGAVVDVLGREHALHDSSHHLGDLSSGLTDLRARPARRPARRAGRPSLSAPRR